MKQFLTLCLASAMLGSSLNVDAKISLERAMQLKSEGKMVKTPIKTRNKKALKTLPKASAVSGFHKLLNKKAEKDGRMMAPAKVTSKGDNIYGYLGFTYGDDALGLYELEESGMTFLWADQLVEELELATSPSLGLQDGVLKGYCLDYDPFWGFIYGMYYMEYNFETGEVLKLEAQDLNTNTNYIQFGTLDTETNTFYGYGVCDGAFGLVSANVDDPFNYTLVGATDDYCMSMCYNPDDSEIYGVTLDYKLVTVSKTDGSLTELMDLEVENGATYLTGLVYDPISKLFYWNINTNDDASYLATIDVASQKLDIIDEYYNAEEWMSFYTTDEVVDPYKPGRPKAGAADFYKANLIGFVSYTLPTEMADGKPIVTNEEGMVVYKTFVNGELYTVGSDVPGAEVRVNFAVPEDGSYAFAMCVETTQEVDGEMLTSESSMATVKTYVGNDTPLAPTNVVLDAKQVSWTPVTSDEGVHGGYVDVRAITYNVFLNGQPVAANVAGDSCPVDIDKDAELSTYNATVTAEANGHVSVSASSNTIVEGAAMALPYYIAPTYEEFTLSEVLDKNEDGATWQYTESFQGGSAIYSGWNSYNQMDEWYFLPPVKLDDPTKFYTFSMDVCLRSEMYPGEYVEVLLCTKDDNGNVQISGTIMEEFSPESSVYELASEQFRIRQEGDYYIAIHCTSDADQYGIYAANFKVEENNITLESPAAVDDLELEPAAEGELKATATFTMPTATFGGGELAADAELVATLSCGENQATVSGKPGEEVSAEIATAQGNNRVIVTVALGDMNSPLAYANVFTGMTTPATPQGLVGTLSDDAMSVVLTWDAVTEPADEDGVVNPETIVYNIYKLEQSLFGSYWALYDEGVTETTYTYVASGDAQEFVQLGVCASNEAGESNTLAVVSAVVGTPYKLPIIETFDEAQDFTTQPWVIYSEDVDNAPEAGLYYTQAFDESAPAESICLAVMGGADAAGQLRTPLFSTLGCSTVTFTAEIDGDYFLPKITIYAEAEGIEMEEIGTMTQDEEGFQKVSVALPAEFMGKNHVSLYIGYEFENGDEVLVIKSLAIEADGNSVASLAGQSVKVMGGKNVINVTGLNGENVTVADLNGRVVAKSAKVANAASFQVEKGIYVVEAGDKKVKVVVK